MQEKRERFARTVDDFLTTDFVLRGNIRGITEAVFDVQGPTPSMRAAELLKDTVGAGDPVLLLTGFPEPPMIVPETDGPIGAASIARAVDRGLNANPVISCEDFAVEACEATATAAGLRVVNRDVSFQSQRTVAVEAFPSERDAAKQYAENVMSEIEPTAVIAIEKVGSNRVGEFHNLIGINVTEHAAKVDELFDILSDDVVTIAVGDGGNEIGMGKIEETVRNVVEHGDVCQCRCGEGIADSTETDVLVPSTVSNWGSHSIVTCLSYLLDQSLLHEPAVERRMLEEASMAGAIDGSAGGTNAWCDGLPPSVHESIVGLLRETLQSAINLEKGNHFQ